MKTITTSLLITVLIALTPRFVVAQKKWRAEDILAPIEARNQVTQRNHNSEQRKQPTYGFKEISKDLYVDVFIQCPKNYNLDQYGFIQSQYFAGINTGQLPISSLKIAYNDPFIESIKVANGTHLQMDTARVLTKVDQVHQGTGLPQSFYGEGVIVGVVDVGFDYTRPDFYDSTYSSYRVSRVWEHGNNSGIPPSNFSRWQWRVSSPYNVG